MTDYLRPTLSEEEQIELLKFIPRYLASKKQNQIRIIAFLLTENAVLTKECNEHRQKLGFAALPTYNPNGGNA